MNVRRIVTNSVLAIVIAVLALSPAVFAEDPLKRSFSDTGSHWAKENISYLTDNGAIKGYTDGTFKPENKISRAEFTAILLRALKTDVGQPKEGKWYENYITEATNRKYIVKGEFDNVEKNITRGEMARMIVRTMNEEYPVNMADYASQLSDYSKIAEAYKDFVMKAYVKGIITGRPGGIFAYKDTATRAEATTMIVRLIDTTKRVIPEEPVSEDVFIYESALQKEVAIETSHSKLLPHISKAIEILSSEVYAKAKYFKENNHVQFYVYKDKTEADKPVGTDNPILSYHFYTEQDPRDRSTYLPYQVHLYDITNSRGQQLFKEIIKDIFPDAYDKIISELNKKINDLDYQGKVWEKVSDREIRIFTFAGQTQIDAYIALEN